MLFLCDITLVMGFVGEELRDYFDIDPKTGDLFIKKALDRENENQTKVEITVRAIDTTGHNISADCEHKTAALKIQRRSQ